MKIIKIDKSTRKLSQPTTNVGYIEENNIDKIKFIIPDEYKNYTKKACFKANNKEFSLLIVKITP